MRLPAFVVTAALGAALALAGPAFAAPTTYTVNDPIDSGDGDPNDAVCDVDPGEGVACTLRAAINASNFNPDDDTIEFDFPTQPQTIVLNASLPQVTDAVVIDGYSEDGAAPNTNAGFTAFNAIVNVAIDGNGHIPFVVTGGNTTIKGLRIHDSGGNAIQLDGAGGNHIEGNFIGASDTDTPEDRNIGAGVAVFNGDDNDIGGTTAAERNVISGNGEPLNLNFNVPPYGVLVRGDADGTTIQGNLIGTAADGVTALANGFYGVRIGGVTSGDNPEFTSAPNTLLGGTAAGAGNVISGNGDSNVFVGPEGGTGISILGNRIGTDVSGTSAIINGRDGIELLTNQADQSAAPVQVGDAAGHGNVISGNAGRGLMINSPGHTIQGNRIGTNAAGTAALPNGASGIYNNGQAGNAIGGTSQGARNVISGNGGDGVTLAETAASNDVQGNFIGTNAAGDAALPNGGAGVEVEGGTFNLIGGQGFPLEEQGGGNLISGNTGPGIAIVPAEGPQATDNTVTGNLIGTKADGTGALGNGGEGVYINGGSANYIGGTQSLGNIIGNNAGDGVAVEDNEDEGFPTGNEISANAIFSNGGLGIDLLPDGVTANDADDPDSGPNTLQNFPVITTVTPGASTTIAGTLNSTPDSEYRVEFFENTACDPSKYGEGERFLGSTLVTTDAGGDAAFSASVPHNVASDRFVTATATSQDEGVVTAAIAPGDADSTSEFSECFPRAVEPEGPGNTPTDPPVTPQEPEPEPGRPACRDFKPPLSFLKRGDVRGTAGKVRIGGPSILRLRGRARDVNPCPSGVRRVLVSLARVNGPGGTNCRFIKHPNRYDLGKPGNCRAPILFRTKGTRRWRFTFRAPLEPGEYRVRVRAFDRAGNKEKPARRNGVVFRVH